MSKVVGGDALCLGGGLFYHSSINSAIACSRRFGRVFVPIDPGDAGLALGCTMHTDAATPSPVAPFPKAELHPRRNQVDARQLQAPLHLGE